MSCGWIVRNNVTQWPFGPINRPNNCKDKSPLVHWEKSSESFMHSLMGSCNQFDFEGYVKFGRKWKCVVGAEEKARASCTRGKNGGNVRSLPIINISDSKYCLISFLLVLSACVSTYCVRTEYFSELYLFDTGCVFETVRVSKGARLGFLRLLPVKINGIK